MLRARNVRRSNRSWGNRFWQWQRELQKNIPRSWILAGIQCSGWGMRCTLATIDFSRNARGLSNKVEGFIGLPKWDLLVSSLRLKAKYITKAGRRIHFPWIFLVFGFPLSPRDIFVAKILKKKKKTCGIIKLSESHRESSSFRVLLVFFFLLLQLRYFISLLPIEDVGHSR